MGIQRSLTVAMSVLVGGTSRFGQDSIELDRIR